MNKYDVLVRQVAHDNVNSKANALRIAVRKNASGPELLKAALELDNARKLRDAVEKAIVKIYGAAS